MKQTFRVNNKYGFFKIISHAYLILIISVAALSLNSCTATDHPAKKQLSSNHAKSEPIGYNNDVPESKIKSIIGRLDNPDKPGLSKGELITLSMAYLEKARNLDDKSRPNYKEYIKASESFNKTGEYWDFAPKRAAKWAELVRKNTKNKEKGGGTWIIEVISRDAKIIEKYLDIGKGDIVADVGVGPGFFLYEFAEKVGGNGRVYAVDINPNCFTFLKKVRKKRKYQNVEYVHNTVKDVKLPPKTVDVAFLRHVSLFDNDPDGKEGMTGERKQNSLLFIKSIHKALKHNGKIVILDAWQAGNRNYMRKSRDKLVENLENTGLFKLDRLVESNRNNFIVLKKVNLQ